MNLFCEKGFYITFFDRSMTAVKFRGCGESVPVLSVGQEFSWPPTLTDSTAGSVA